MTNFKLISRFIGLSSVLTTALFALRSRRTAPPNPQVDALGSQSALESYESDNEESRTWPPPEGVYWGM